MIKMRMPASRETIGWRCAMPKVMLRALLKHDLRKAADFADHIMRRNKPTARNSHDMLWKIISIGIKDSDRESSIDAARCPERRHAQRWW